MISTKMPKIKIHFSLIILIVIAGYTGFLKQLLIILSVSILHELGHLLFIYLFKGKLKQINFTIIGGLIDYEVPHLSTISKCLINFGRPGY